MAARGFPAAARESLRDSQLRHNLATATQTIREKRARVVGELADWEALRDAGAAIKARAMATLPEQLERLEAAVDAAGGVVHWARDAGEACAIVARLAREHRADELLKVKSMATEEIGHALRFVGHSRPSASLPSRSTRRPEDKVTVSVRDPCGSGDGVRQAGRSSG